MNPQDLFHCRRFSRTELLPIEKTAEGIAKYISKFIAKPFPTKPAFTWSSWLEYTFEED